ncbi:cysteine desulfurase/selenocysteine lyase [Weissella beninensis]|uniref:Cysteine desulfurase n=1 Tax=Periweissella beninensis TaxID=504936 RepID=A0ABT0VHX8_9LACO|nr:SufS family cysteine desulfurase [Periweissella beninensis]MBM7543441.1 cysteine desulfurase/selenocysteine lyase [Periweissella beninensis]MCM2437266.1 SufS family cysteine desulfurase [Periweissella beninensis]
MDNSKKTVNVRQDFAILATQMNQQPLIYLDNAATTQKPQQVIEAIMAYYNTANANVHRGTYTLANNATNQYEQARTTVAKFIQATAEEIIFTRSTTESLNWIAKSYESKLQTGDEIVLTVAEHHSNIVPWQQLAQKTGAVLRFIKLDQTGKVSLTDAQQKITNKTKIVTFAYVSNVLGMRAPILELIKLAHAKNAITVIDGAQAMAHFPIDVMQLDIDFLAFSGHKMYGPTGIGVLYGKKALLEDMEPLQFGGEMIDEVTQDTATWQKIPWKFEAGTPNIAGAIGLAAAIDYLKKIGWQKIISHEQALMQATFKNLKTIPNLIIYGSQVPEDHYGVISFNLADLHPHDIATGLDLAGIAIRAGQHCAQPLMDYLHVLATLRISTSIYNQSSEVRKVAKILKELEAFFKS